MVCHNVMNFYQLKLSKNYNSIAVITLRNLETESEVRRYIFHGMTD